MCYPHPARCKRITVTQSSPQTPSLQYERAGGVQNLFFVRGAALPGSI